jgi:hypothetical protein
MHTKYFSGSSLYNQQLLFIMQKLTQRNALTYFMDQSSTTQTCNFQEHFVHGLMTRYDANI